MNLTRASIIAFFLVTPALAQEPSLTKKLSILFRGSPPPDQLEGEMNAVLAKYGLEPNEEGRRKLGNVLIALQQDGDISGYAILTCMDELRKSIGRELATSAALCAVAIKARQQ